MKFVRTRADSGTKPRGRSSIRIDSAATWVECRRPITRCSGGWRTEPNFSQAEGFELQVRVFVTPRKGILDPQGRAVESSLNSLGFKNVSGVKVGKYILLEVEARTASEARD